jgi:hypothetical protein
MLILARVFGGAVFSGTGWKIGLFPWLGLVPDRLDRSIAPLVCRWQLIFVKISLVANSVKYDTDRSKKSYLFFRKEKSDRASRRSIII